MIEFRVRVERLALGLGLLVPFFSCSSLFGSVVRLRSQNRSDLQASLLERLRWRPMPQCPPPLPYPPLPSLSARRSAWSPTLVGSPTQAFPEFRKLFCAALGLPIAPRETPYHEGTGGLYLRLSSDAKDERVALLTCAHVVRPPSAFSTNTLCPAPTPAGRRSTWSRSAPEATTRLSSA